MAITGKKRWLVLFLAAFMAGIMVYVPFLRYSYYDQMVILFTEFKPVSNPSAVNEFIGAFGMWFGIVCTIGYPIGGILVDKFGEKWLLILGAAWRNMLWIDGALMIGLAVLMIFLLPGDIKGA